MLKLQVKEQLIAPLIPPLLPSPSPLIYRNLIPKHLRSNEYIKVWQRKGLTTWATFMKTEKLTNAYVF